MHPALHVIPAAYRDRITITTADDTPEALHITFADVLTTAEQRAAIAATEPNTRACRRAEQALINELAKEVRKMRAKVAGALRATGFDVADADGEHARVIGDCEGSTVPPLMAVPVVFGDPVSDAGRAWESGVCRGWDHANFVTAYGKEHDRRSPDVPESYHRCAEAFEQGWREGRKRYTRGLWQDGSKRES
ncbi:hypothetical protein [Streptomyces sp. MMS24-I29]|uniref:hypothetical protein n=1 Tax=Streptomyces sp. MMS24-I29 TaxID=3351480 RepID=UPI003C7CCDC3